MLRGKKIVLGVCGSIAAYKAAILVRLLVKEGAEVQVIMTSSASSFITPLTLSTLSKKPVLVDFIKNEAGEWNNHVELGLWADALVIAPATANTIAKFSVGLCDNLLSAVYLSARCPVFFAPAMDLDMYQHASTQENLFRLKKYGNILIDAEYGELASGLTGTGRMAEPENIIQTLKDYLNNEKPLKGKKALVTAGPTYEEIDPVRFIGNHSSGKMGYALAEELSRQGAFVTLVSGPSQLHIHNGDIKVIKVTSADEMFHASVTAFKECDIAVLAAAVADYRPKTRASQKIKKNENLSLELEKTKDIALELGKAKSSGQLIVGFALESENELENARRKLKAKNFDLIVLNSLNDKGAGFGFDTNQVSIIDKHNKITEIELKSKKEVAREIVNRISSFQGTSA